MVSEYRLRDAIERVVTSASVQELLEQNADRISADDLRKRLKARTSDFQFDLSRELQGFEADQQAWLKRSHLAERAMENRFAARIGRIGRTMLILCVLGLIALQVWNRTLLGGVFAAWTILRSPPPWDNIEYATVTAWGGLLLSLLTMIGSNIENLIQGRRLKKLFDESFEVDAAVTVYRQAERRLAEAFDDRVLKAVVEIFNVLAQDPYQQAKIFVSDNIPTSLRTIGLGLSEVPELDNLAPTAKQRELIRLLNEQPGGSFGISGPRGVGKSTLLSMVCDGNLEIGGGRALAINVAAPVEYDGREFLLHLFSSLCRKVLEREIADPRLNQEQLISGPIHAWRRDQALRHMRPLGGLLLALGAVFGALSLNLGAWLSDVNVDFLKREAAPATSMPPEVIGHLQSKTTNSKSDAAKQAPPAATVAQADLRRPTLQAARVEARRAELAKMFGPQVGVLALFGVTCLIIGGALLLQAFIVNTASEAELGRRVNIFARALGVRQARGKISPMVEETLNELRNIRFQRSFTAGWSGALKFPAAFEMGATGGMAFAQNPESLPELVERFRRYATRAAQHYGRVIIGIDELDKLKTTKDAEVFLNNVKSVFNIKGCFYLISVSEHALASFERRGIGFRDAFDSALDLVLQIDYCDLRGSGALLRPRILRWPTPFLHLNHMLSGGLPRDLIRSARDIIAIAGTRGEKGATIKLAADEVIAHEARTKIRATSIALRQADENHDASDLLVRVASLADFSTVLQLTRRVAGFKAWLEASAPAENVGRNRLLCQELAVYLGMLTQIHRVASLSQTEEGWQEIKKLDLTDKVTGVRQALEVSMPLAAARLEATDRVIVGAETRIAAIRKRRIAKAKAEAQIKADARINLTKAKADTLAGLKAAEIEQKALRASRRSKAGVKAST